MTIPKPGDSPNSATRAANCQFVAEVSSNHSQDLGRCLRFIERAAEIGCSAVKFQLFRMDQLFAPEILRHSAEHRQRSAWELPASFLPHLAEKSHSNGIQFACTPFDLEAVELLYPYVDLYKIASYELLWHPLLKACAETGKPLVVSTGMATLDEIRVGVDQIRSAGCMDLTLLHCHSHYPTPVEDCNLAAIETMRQAFGCPVGWSDHSVRPEVLYRAAYHWGAAMIEFHFDLDGQGEEFGLGHCWLSSDIQEIITSLQSGFTADGNPQKVPTEREQQERTWRADPIDGLRPLKSTRRLLAQTQAQSGSHRPKSSSTVKSTASEECVVAVVQARMGSTRLPGKVMRPILGRPMLWHIVQRVRQTSGVDKLVVATSDRSSDEPTRRFCREHQIDCTAGSEQDVLDRFYQTASTHKGDPLLRVTADCPFVDPRLIDKLLELFGSAAYDHVGVATGAGVLHSEQGRFPDGLDTECFSFEALWRAWSEATRPSDREHVTPYMWRVPGRFRNGALFPHRNYCQHRWTVDTESDFDLVSRVYENLYREDQAFSMDEILDYLYQHPELALLNQDLIGAEQYQSVWGQQQTLHRSLCNPDSHGGEHSKLKEKMG